jgi:uncharacterized repeat protein (TIGR04138 family)
MPQPFDFQTVVQLDPRYTVEAYEFVCDALTYARKVLGLGTIEVVGEGTPEAREERHLTGQQLCEASRRLALDRYGMMAKVVLNSWGVNSTSDLGEIVYNLIRVEQMSKSAQDRREDFDNVFDFQKALQDDFDFSIVRPSRGNLPRK